MTIKTQRNYIFHCSSPILSLDNTQVLVDYSSSFSLCLYALIPYSCHLSVFLKMIVKFLNLNALLTVQ